MPKILKELQPILWSTNIKNLDLEKDKDYIVHQILAYGKEKWEKWGGGKWGKWGQLYFS